MALVELERTQVSHASMLLHSWISIGLIYAFVGALGLAQESNTSLVAKEGSEQHATMLEIVKAVAWNMIGCGTLYFVMGARCLQLVLNRMCKSYQARLAEAKQRSASSSKSGGAGAALGESVEAEGDKHDLNLKDTGENGSFSVEPKVEAQDVKSATSVAKSPSVDDSSCAHGKPSK